MQSNLKIYTNSKGESLPKVICAVVDFENKRLGPACSTKKDSNKLWDAFGFHNSNIFSDSNYEKWETIWRCNYDHFYSIFPTCKNSRGQELPEEIQVEIVEERLRQLGQCEDSIWKFSFLHSAKGHEYWLSINNDTDYTPTKSDDTFQTSIALATHLQKLKAESEKKAEEIKVIDRYPMCKDQPAQIDCRRADCIYQNKGQCSNISPAITLNDKSTFVCWSYKDAKGENKAEPFATGKITEAPEGFAEKIRSAGNEIKIKKPIYGESPIISHINDIQMAALIEKISKQFMKGINKATEDIHKPYNPKLTGIVSMSDVTTVAVKPEPSIQITDQKAREICAKYFNCPPNEIKIV